MQVRFVLLTLPLMLLAACGERTAAAQQPPAPSPTVPVVTVTATATATVTVTSPGAVAPSPEASETPPSRLPDDLAAFLKNAHWGLNPQLAARRLNITTRCGPIPLPALGAEVKCAARLDAFGIHPAPGQPAYVVPPNTHQVQTTASFTVTFQDAYGTWIARDDLTGQEISGASVVTPE